MTIPFTKAHGAKNDFLLTWSSQVPRSAALSDIAVAICDRYTGVGADGWMLVTPAEDGKAAAIRLFNSDGSEPEISGNGTRCAAAFLLDAGHSAPDVPIRTGAGLKQLRLMRREGNVYSFEMNMGRPVVQHADERFHGCPAVILDVGNPQCALFVEDFSLDWRSIGAELERHPRFPNRTNVSFIRVVDGHTIDVRFFERGAGETMSSGTGSTGAAAAAVSRGLVQSPVTVQTPAGDLHIDWRGDEAYLTGPAEITVRGEFYLNR